MAPSHEGDQVLLELECLMFREFFEGTSKDSKSSFSRGSAFYSYDRLLGTSCIRLLTLYRGAGDEPLRASLRQVSRHENISYEALSYTWGSPAKPFQIIVDEGLLSITTSLRTALLHLRKPAAERILWIDALCINQNDNEEKSSQVSMMHDIYASASRVLCWLGEDKNRDGLHTIQLLERVSEMGFDDISTIAITSAQLRSKGLPEFEHPLWYSAHRFFENAWFRRGWVIQEVVQAREPILLCGELELPWEKLLYALEMLSHYQIIIKATSVNSTSAVKGLIALVTMLTKWSSRTLSGHYTTLIRTYVNRGADALSEFDVNGTTQDAPIREIIVWLRSTRAAMGRTGGAPFATDPSVMGNLLAGMGGLVGQGPLYRLPLHETILWFHTSITTDPRDMYYALLGISTDKDDPALRPDYDETPDATRLRFTRFFMLRPKDWASRRRNILAYAGLAHRGAPPLSGTLPPPSWVAERFTPRASVETDPFLNIVRVRMTYFAAGSSVMSYRSGDDGDPRAIVGRGSRLDVVSRLLPQPGRRNLNYPAVYAEFFREVDRMILHRRKPYPRPLPAGETMEDVQWRTLIADVDQKCSPVDGSFRALYRQGRRQFETGAYLHPTRAMGGPARSFDMLGEWVQRWLFLVSRYQICETVGGYVGLVPMATRPGDEVCIIRGEGMPILLRPLESDASKRQVVGACYVHGVMKGEAFRSDGWKEEEFYLV